MKCDSQASLLAHTFVSPCFGRKPKAKIATSNMLIPQNSKTILAQKSYTVIEKTRMYYINYHMTNHNVENCRIKRKENHVRIIFEVTTQQIKIQKPMMHYCHICGDTGHKIIDCLKYSEMQNMFKNKGMKTTKKPYVVEPKVTNSLVHIVDVNMAITNSKVIEEQVFKDK
jgi:hypothetical protein